MSSIVKMNYLKFIIIYIIKTCVTPSQGYQADEEWRIYKSSTNAYAVSQRFLELMNSYVVDARTRTSRIRKERIMYEETPHYEMGYLIAEIVERYKAAVEHAQWVIDYKYFHVFVSVRQLQLVEFCYYEVYHLVNMFHEIKNKFWWEKEFADFRIKGDKTKILQPNSDTLQEYLEYLEDQERRRKRERERQRKKGMKYFNRSTTTHKPYNKYWPIDYGWEVNNYW